MLGVYVRVIIAERRGLVKPSRNDHAYDSEKIVASRDTQKHELLFSHL